MENKNVDNKTLNEYLDSYLSIENPQYAVLLNGKWGSGKTYLIKERIKYWNKTNTLKEDTNKVSNNKCLQSLRKALKKREDSKTVFKPVYVSLYGLADANEINNKIKEELNPLLYSKGVKITKAIAKGLLKKATSINIDIDSDGKSDGKVSFDVNSLALLKGNNQVVKGNKILIFDDLERCSIKIHDLFGYINEFVEHHQCKVILLCDEEKIKSKDDEVVKEDEFRKVGYAEFKEKLIGQTFTINPEIDNALNFFIKEYLHEPIKGLLTSSVERIYDVFVASGEQNLRVLRQAINDLDRFVKYFDKEITSHSNYQKFIKSFIVHYFIAYLECKSGNLKVEKVSGYNMTKITNEGIKLLNQKYLGVIISNEIIVRTDVIEYELFIDFINYGIVDKHKLSKSLKNNLFFRESKVLDWEKLWSWEDLEDCEFRKLYKSVRVELRNKEIENEMILFHVVSIFFNLLENKIIKCNKAQLVKLFEEQFNEILQNNNDRRFVKFTHQSYNKEYRKVDCIEYKNMLDNANRKIEEHNFKVKDDYLKQLFEGITDSNIRELNEGIDEVMPEIGIDNSASLLVTVDGYKLGEALLKLNNRNLSLFFNIIDKRYYPRKMYNDTEINIRLVEDKECLKKVKIRLEKELTRDDTYLSRNRVKCYVVSDWVDYLEDLIKKLEDNSVIEA